MTAGLVAATVVLAVAVVVLAVLLARSRHGGTTAGPARPDTPADVEEPAPGEPIAGEPATEVAAVPAGPPNPGTELVDRLRAVVDGLDQGVVLRDASGGEVYRNAAARRFAEARDSHVLVAAAIEELLDQAGEGRRVRRVVELFGPPAEAFVVTASPFRLPVGAEGAADGEDERRPAGSGPVDGAVAVVEDRSLQRRTETVRRDFVANISHELKTPIGALGLLAETLRDEVAGADPDTEAVQRLADRMTVESDRAASTIDDLLELSRIEFGDDTDFAEVRLAEVVGEAVSRLAPAAEQAGIVVHRRVPADLTVVGDGRQLASALFNLVDNAIKYSPTGSEVTVSTEVEEDDRVRLVVEDHGVGVPRRDLDRIFERFYRVDRARSRGTGGTGLGLAIVRHVASNHGGEVLVSSTEGVGSMFSIVLPRDARRMADRPTDGERGDQPAAAPSAAANANGQLSAVAR